MPFSTYLQRQKFIVIDGALATELERCGADINDPLWSAKVLIEAPELIRQVHYDYFVAGADVVITASYQATFEGFAQRGIDHAWAADLMRLSVQLAQDAREQFWADPTHRAHRIKPLVAASIGPYGAYLHDGSEYRGNYDLSCAQLIDFHRPRLALLANCGADVLACETIPSLLEGQALVALLGEFADQQAWLSFSCCDQKHVCHGEPFAECVALAHESEQIVAVGLNCTPPRFVEPLLRHAQQATNKPLLAYPNSGEGWDATQSTWLPAAETTSFCALTERWYHAGARLIGGCCRTTPDDIRTIRAALHKATC